MTVICVSQVALECRVGTSNKFYVIQIQEEVTAAGTEYQTIGYSGGIGSALKQQPKYKGASLRAAEADRDKLEKEKRKKGYVDHIVAAGVAVRGMPSSAPIYGGASVASATSAPSPTAVVGKVPMLATPIKTEAELEGHMVDSDSIMQRKYDGERAVISIRRGAISATNRDGIVRAISSEVEGELKKLWALTDFNDDRETVFDGELLRTGEFVIYDVITLRDNDVTQLSYFERYSAVEEMLINHQGFLAETAWNEADKRALLAKAIADGWEGLIVRLGSATYVHGRTKVLLKWKLWATATARVLTANGTKRSVSISMLNDVNDEVPVGNVTIPVNHDIPECDTLVEVRYLYITKGNILYQPTYLGARDDVHECDKIADCRQLPPEKAGVSVSTPAAAAPAVELVEDI